MRPHRLRAVERAGQVDPQVALPELRTLVVELGDMVQRPGVVDEDVDRAELGDDTRHRGVDLLARGHVAAQGEGAPAEPADLLHGLLRIDEPLLLRRGRERAPLRHVLVGRLELDVRDRDVGPRARQRQRVGAPEPTRPSGHERDAPGEVDRDGHFGMSSSRAITSRWICEVPS